MEKKVTRVDLIYLIKLSMKDFIQKGWVLIERFNYEIEWVLKSWCLPNLS